MGGRLFDVIISAWAEQALDRRGCLRLLVATAIGSGIRQIGSTEAENKKGKGNDKDKDKNKKKRGGGGTPPPPPPPPPPTCGECPACMTCVDSTCVFLPLPNCPGCQEPRCMNGSFQCAETGVGVTCGTLCCDEATATCCTEIPGIAYCDVPHPPCAACQILCRKPDANVCCSSTEVCCNDNTSQAQCKHITQGC